MTTKLSSKGQIVLPKLVRTRLHWRPGTKFVCKVEGDSLVLTPENPVTGRPKLVIDAKSGLRITKSPAQTKVTSKDVHAAMLDFP
jgi:AbrB family looped-hinge helix DNA binding protein